MTNPTTKPEALISTPAEAAQCPTCMAEYDDRFDRAQSYEGWTDEDRAEFAGPMPTCSRFEGASYEFPHCDTCGGTSLVDVRSPFEVLAEAIRNAETPIDLSDRPVFRHLSPEAVAQIEATARMERMDVVERVRAIAAATPAGHCSDCTTWAARVAVAGVRF